MGVIQILNPIWLAAVAAVVVPVILHLWNDRRGKVLRVGSVTLLTGGAQRMAWRRRLSDWLLLLVRCLLLVALALLMAGPVLHIGVKGWVLGAGRVADSLVKAGWERHSFADSTNYWEEFRLADREAPAGAAFYVRTTGLARRFGGERPMTDRAVRWDVDLAGDSVNRWTEAAWVLPGDSVRVIEGVSRATGTSYSPRTVGASTGGDTNVLRVTVIADAVYRKDARRVKAALVALQKYTLRRIAVVDTAFAGASAADGGRDWLIWLSDRPVSGRDGYKKILDYAAWKRSSGKAANDLLWSGAFPVWVGKTLFVDTGAGTKDLRVLDPEQIVPLHAAGVGAAGGSKVLSLVNTGVETVIWGITILLFIMERILSHGKKKA
jgi:aerotolerance regulator-like protein